MRSIFLTLAMGLLAACGKAAEPRRVEIGALVPLLTVDRFGVSQDSVVQRTKDIITDSDQTYAPHGNGGTISFEFASSRIANWPQGSLIRVRVNLPLQPIDSAKAAGDSVERSLRDLGARRLGEIEYPMVDATGQKVGTRTSSLWGLNQLFIVLYQGFTVAGPPGKNHSVVVSIQPNDVDATELGESPRQKGLLRELKTRH
jgi:hypothetical protein